MKVKNTSFSQLVISLPGGTSIQIAARGSKDISEEEFNMPECQRLFKERKLIVLPEQPRQSTSSPA